MGFKHIRITLANGQDPTELLANESSTEDVSTLLQKYNYSADNRGTVNRNSQKLVPYDILLYMTNLHWKN